jgi:hydroxymethylbilane synthase
MASAEETSTASSAPGVSAANGTITIGTRRSQLARIQADIVSDALRKAFPSHEYRIHAMDPLGDRDKVTALYRFNNDNAKGLWTHELEELLLTGELDLVVHSLKGIAKINDGR